MGDIANQLRRRRQIISRSGYIHFEDPEIERICIANWSSDGIGLTYEDAAAVTNISNSIFSNNLNIQTFYEFIYFTGITAMGYDWFTGSTNLYKIGIPPNITILGARNDQFREIHVANIDSFLSARDNGFYLTKNNVESHLYLNGTEITSVTFPYGMTDVRMACLLGFRNISSISLPNSITTIKNYAFASTGIQSITLPNNLTSIGSFGFYRCTGLQGKTIEFPQTLATMSENVFRDITPRTMVFIFRSTTPPTLTSGSYGILNIANKIYVPYSADHSILNTYKTATSWNTYESNIYELDENGNIPS